MTLTLKQRRIILLVAALASAGIVFTINNPFAGNPTLITVSETGEVVEVTLGLVPNTNLAKTDKGVGVKVGEAAPNFVLGDQLGKLEALDDYRGKVVLVNFWATWCPFCLEEMPDLQKVSQEFKGDVVVLGINNMESPGQGESYVADLDVTYPVLYFPDDDEIVNAYDVFAMPTTYYLDRDGIVRVVWRGFDNLEGMRDKITRTLQGASAG